MSIKKKGKKTKKIPLSERFTNWVGSQSSLVIHTIFFGACFISVLFGVDLEEMLLILTTVVSLEAIYLAIFIQMTVNRNTLSLKAVEEDIDEIQEDIDEIQEDVELIEKDIDEIQEDVDEIQENVDEIQEDDEAGEEEEDKVIDFLQEMEKRMQELKKDIQALKKK